LVLTARSWKPLVHLQTREVGAVLERAVKRMVMYLSRQGAHGGDDGADVDATEGEQRLIASAVSGQTPPAGPQWQRGLAVLTPRAPDRISGSLERAGITSLWGTPTRPCRSVPLAILILALARFSPAS
jgi:hypothetical protein